MQLLFGRFKLAKQKQPIRKNSKRVNIMPQYMKLLSRITIINSTIRYSVRYFNITGITFTVYFTVYTPVKPQSLYYIVTCCTKSHIQLYVSAVSNDVYSRARLSDNVSAWYNSPVSIISNQYIYIYSSITDTMLNLSHTRVNDCS